METGHTYIAYKEIMRFYQLQVDPYEVCDDCRWFTSRAKAKKEQRRLQQDGNEVNFKAYDV